MGRAFVNDRGEAAFRDPGTGERLWIDQRDAEKAALRGFVPMSRDDVIGETQRDMAEQSPNVAIGAAALRGLSLGMSDVALEAASPGYLRELREAHPGSSLAAEVVGSIPHAFTGPVAALGKAAARAVPAAGAGVARAVVEGAAVGAGTGVSRATLEEMDPEDAVAAVAREGAVGALLGGVLSAGALGLGRLTKAVRGAKGAQLEEVVGTRQKFADDIKERNAVAARNPELAMAIEEQQIAEAAVRADHVAGIKVEPREVEHLGSLLDRQQVLSDDLADLARRSGDDFDTLVADAKAATEQEIELLAQQKAASKELRKVVTKGKVASPAQMARLQVMAADPRLTVARRQEITKLVRGVPEPKEVRKQFKLWDDQETGWLPDPPGERSAAMSKELRRLRDYGGHPDVGRSIRERIKRFLGGKKLLKKEAVKLREEAERSLGYPRLIQEQSALQDALRFEARTGTKAAKEAAEGAAAAAESARNRLRTALGDWKPRSELEPWQIQDELDAVSAQLDSLKESASNFNAMTKALRAQRAQDGVRKAAAAAGLGTNASRTGVDIAGLDAAARNLQEAEGKLRGSLFGSGIAGLAVGGAVGSVVHGVAAMLAWRVLPLARQGLSKALTNGNVLKVMGVGRVAARHGLTRVVAAEDFAGLPDPEEVRAAALEGYQEAGVEPFEAGQAAEFQARRAALLQAAAGMRGRKQQDAVAAAANPFTILQRIDDRRMRPWDPQLIEAISPALAYQLRQAAREALEADRKRRALDHWHRNMLRRLAGDPKYASLQTAAQQAHAQERAEAEQANRRAQGHAQARPMPANDLQRIEAGGGPGLRE